MYGVIFEQLWKHLETFGNIWKHLETFIIIKN